MRRINKFILAFLLPAGILYSCYEDKGNYDYTALKEIKVSGIEEDYTCFAAKDTLKIHPELSLPEEAASHCWMYYRLNMEGARPTLDTVGTEKDLIFPVHLPAGNYQFVYQVKNREGFSSYAKFKVAVITQFAEGWFVLKDQEGTTDLDLFRFDSVTFRDVIRAINKEPLAGNAVALGYTQKYDYMDSVKTFARVLFVASDKDLKVVRIEDMNVVSDFSNMFYNVPEERKVQSWISDWSGYLLLNDNKVFSIFGTGSNSGKFGLCKEGIYSANPYMVTAPFGNLVYDDNTSSFYGLDMAGTGLISFSEEIGKASPKNLNSRMCYMGRVKPGTGGARAFLKKNSNADTLLVLRIGMMMSMNKYANPIEQIDTVTQKMQLETADCYALNREYEYLYFGKENVWMRYDLENKEEKEMYTFPAGEKITFMRHMIYTGEAKKAINEFVVATYNGGSYKVYRFNLQAGRPENNTYKGTPMEGEGCVRSVQYVTTGMTLLNIALCHN